MGAPTVCPYVGWASTHYMPLTGAHKNNVTTIYSPLTGAFFLFKGIRLDRAKALSYDILPFQGIFP